MSVVLPASGCEMIANVRRRAMSASREDPAGVVAGAVTAESLPHEHAEGDLTHAGDDEPAVEETAAPVDEARKPVAA